MKKCCDLYYKKYITKTGEIILKSYLEAVTLYLHSQINMLKKKSEDGSPILVSFRIYQKKFDNFFDQTKICKCSCHIEGNEIKHQYT